MWTPQRPGRPVLIAGGGIGGLAAALALADRGFCCHVLEKRPAFAEAGAGIQIGPNGVKALRVLGVDGALSSKVGVPDAIVVRDGRRGGTHATLPLGAAIADRFGAPYWTAHRADLHGALLARAVSHPDILLTLGFGVNRVETMADGVRVTAEGGGEVAGDALIGADGLWSRTRIYVAGHTLPTFTGRRAYRAIVPAGTTAPAFAGNGVGLWLAPGCHVVHYPIRGGGAGKGHDVAVVVILPDEGASVDWSAGVSTGHVSARVAHLDPGLRAAVNAADDWRSWALFDAAPLPSWSKGRTVLVGDAAHPVLPFLAQGGVLALEDAVTLADAIAGSGGDWAAAFAAYGRSRAPRARRVADAARTNGRIYHLSVPAALARNLVLHATPPQRLIGRYDWLYGWTPPASSAQTTRP